MKSETFSFHQKTNTQMSAWVKSDVSSVDVMSTGGWGVGGEQLSEEEIWGSSLLYSKT